MAVGTPKTKIVDGERIDIETGEPFVDPALNNAVEISNATDSLSPNATRQGPITSEDLSDEPDFEIVEPVAPVETAGLDGVLEAQEEFAQEQSKKAETARKNEAESFDELMDFVEGRETESEIRSREFANEGVDDLRAEVDTYDQQLREERRALQKKRERIQSEAGLTKGQANQRINEIERKSLSKQADISILRQGAVGRYEIARDIAQRAVDVKMEEQENRLDALDLQYSRNKQLFTKEEQRAFEENQSARKEKAANERATLETIYDRAITAQENGAPSTVVQSILASDSIEDAIQRTGVYATDQTVSDGVETEDFLSPNQLSQVEDLYGFTPKPWMTMSQIRQFVADNPGASPEELQEAVNNMSAPGQETATPSGDELSEAQIQQKVQEARAAGFSDEEIENFLQEKFGVEIDLEEDGAFRKILQRFGRGVNRLLGI